MSVPGSAPLEAVGDVGECYAMNVPPPVPLPAGPEDLDLEDVPVEVLGTRPAGLVLRVRLTAPEAEQLMRVAEKRGTTVTALAREAIAELLQAEVAGTVSTRL